MAGSTPIFGFPYPDPSDLVANYPALGQQLAEDVEDAIYARKILQIVRATDTTNRTTTSTSFVDVTGMSVTITPQKNNSAIIIAAIGWWQTNMAADGANYGNIRLTDSSNNALSGAQTILVGANNITGAGTRSFWAPYNIWAYSTPAAITAQTYKMRFSVDDANTTLLLRNDQATGQMYAIEVSA
jgi:hypothetical protein